MKSILYKLGLTSSTLLLIVMGLSGVALADGGDDGKGQIQIIDGYQVAFILAGPARVDENQFHLRVSDAQEHPVTHAVITVRVVKSESGQAEAEHGDAAHEAVETSHDTHNSSADSSAHTDTEAHSDAGPLTLEPGEKSGEYTGEIVIPQAGSWIIRAHLTIDDLPMEVDFPVTVAPTRNGWAILTGFIAVNVVILGAAAVLRPRKLVKTPQP